jgi:hypothetical protein
MTGLDMATYRNLIHSLEKGGETEKAPSSAHNFIAFGIEALVYPSPT